MGTHTHRIKSNVHSLVKTVKLRQLGKALGAEACLVDVDLLSGCCPTGGTGRFLVVGLFQIFPPKRHMATQNWSNFVLARQCSIGSLAGIPGPLRGLKEPWRVWVSLESMVS